MNNTLNVNAQTDLLTELCSKGCFGDSVKILSRVTKRYVDMLGWVEEYFRRTNESRALREVALDLSDAEKLFLFRTCAVRVNLDEIVENIISGNTSGARSGYNELQIILEDLRTCYRTNKDVESDWSKLGFDMTVCLTSPFPLTVSAWVWCNE